MDKRFLFRTQTLLLLFGMVLLVFFLVLINVQLVHGDDYRARSVRSIADSETVEASRGILTDRNGKVLVSNRATYAVTFDTTLLSKEEINPSILRLLQMFEQQNISWVDTLPISREAPFLYTLSSATSSQRSRLSKFLQNRKWSDKTLSEEDPVPDLTAEDLMAKMRSYFDIDPALSDSDARKIIGVRYELALRKLINTTEYILAEDVSSDLISILADGQYSGAVIRSSSMRQYETDYAAHVLGRVSRITGDDDYEGTLKDLGYDMDDFIGRSGAESAFESYLRGSDGERLITKNSQGTVTGEVYSVPPQPGSTVALTIDIDLQQVVEEALAQRIEEMVQTDGLARAGAAVVVQVGTGEVLALASYPTFSLATYSQDLVQLQQDPMSPEYNRATMGTYAPGSTFKPCTAIAALETGIITTKTKIRDLGRYTYYKDYQPRCWIYTSRGTTHGLVDVSQAITDSCNYFFYDVGRQTGISTIAKYASLFGLGESTGIEIPERTGHMTTPDYVNSLEGDYWTDGLTLQAAIGQAKSEFTPLQLANYIAALCGNGDRYAAHLLKSVTSYDGTLLENNVSSQPIASVSMTPANQQAVLEGMHRLVQSGSIASYFKDCIVDAGAKTGTAQTTSKTSNGVFVCFAPFDDPEIAVAIVIEKGDSGGALASVGVNILNGYFSSNVPVEISGENQLL